MTRRRVDMWTPMAASLTVLLVIVLALQAWRASHDTLPANALEALRLVHAKVLEAHVAGHDAEHLLHRAIAGMVEELDAHSRFVLPDEVQNFEQTEITGTYQGIGAVFVTGLSPPTVHFPLDDGPAGRAGLEVGDRIIAIDGEPIQGDSAEDQLDDAQERLRGPAGTTVEVHVERMFSAAGQRMDSPRHIALSIERGSVRVPAARFVRFVGGPEESAIGYVHVADFQRDVATQVESAIAELEATAQQRGGRLAGLVLDLRGNPGGLLTEAVKLAGQFLQGELVLTLKRREDEIVERREADLRDSKYPALPLALLVDQATASASEVVAGALQDHGRARLVGVRTYGKGVVQSIFRWDNRAYRLKLTTAHYYTPKGRSIEKRLRREGDPEELGGLAPDVEVVLEPADSQAIKNRLRLIGVPYHLRDAVQQRLVDGMDAKLRGPLGVDEDPQLATAVRGLLDDLGVSGGEPR